MVVLYALLLLALSLHLMAEESRVLSSTSAPATVPVVS